MSKHRILPIAALLLAGAGAMATAQTKIKGSDVVVNGESFFDGSNITSEMVRLARAEGVIGASESFRQIAVAGTGISPITEKYKSTNPKPLYLISDGGGIDMMTSCGGAPTVNCAVIKNTLATVQQYFTAMRTGGTKKVLWMRYPDPLGDRWATLKANHDVYNPEVEKICKASTEPKCLWVDLRTTWDGHPEYTTDGIHCTPAGGTATAQAFWKAMKDNDFFNLETTPVAAPAREKTSFLRGSSVVNRTLHLSLSLDRPLPVALRIRTVSGRTVLAAQTNAEAAGAGISAVRFPMGAMEPGVYTLDVRAGKSQSSSIVLMP